jgi:hypothetical protein
MGMNADFQITTTGPTDTLEALRQTIINDHGPQGEAAECWDELSIFTDPNHPGDFFFRASLDSRNLTDDHLYNWLSALVTKHPVTIDVSYHNDYTGEYGEADYQFSVGPEADLHNLTRNARTFANALVQLLDTKPTKRSTLATALHTALSERHLTFKHLTNLARLQTAIPEQGK